jgi:beta-lactam-binding protein with PASTA domain
MTASAADDRVRRPAEDPANPTVDQADREAAPEKPLAALVVQRVPDEGPYGAARVSQAPDVIGLEMLDAQAVVQEVGLRLAVSVWETKLGPWGLILSQRPEPGAWIQDGTRIHAVVAGRPHRAVPDVRGQRLEAAIDALRRHGLEPVVTAQRASRTMAAGNVVSTRPAAGVLVVDGSRVTLTVARGRAQPGARDGRVRS